MDMQDKEGLFEKWMDEYIAGTIMEKEKQALFSLIHASEVYRLQYNKIAKLHALLQIPALEAEKEKSYQRFSRRLQDVPTGNDTGRRVWMRFAAAAVVLMALASAVSVYTYKYSQSDRLDMLCETIVPFGSQTKMILPDGSVVVLNSGSTLKYPSSFSGKERSVYLAGEGYFEVAKDEAAPFLVYAGEATVRVTGTVFNIRSYPEDVQTEVDLIEGGVNVFIGGKSLALHADEKAVYNRKSGNLQLVACDAYKSSLWTTGKLSFVNASFREILKEIERKYNVKIRVMSTQVEDESFSGTINPDMALQEVFNFIDVDKKYRFENSGSTIVLRDR